MNQRITPVATLHMPQIAGHLGPGRATRLPPFADMRNISHKRELVVGLARKPVDGTAGALLPQVFHDLEGEGEDFDVGFVIVEFDITGAAVPVDVADDTGQSAGPGNRGSAAEKVAKLHGQEDRCAAPVAGLIGESLRNRQLLHAIDPQAPFVAVDIAGVEIGVGERVAVSRVLMCVNEPRRQHGGAAAVEHCGTRDCRAYRVELPHCAQAAIEADMYAIVRTASLREQDLRAQDQAGRTPGCTCRRREPARHALSAVNTLAGGGTGTGAREKGQQDQVERTLPD
ncbi:MAG: hypothetical protein OXG54_08865 [Gammaproteobacteria bacterium]|nr:hypothetical protein [Gammaproteobacteria bacterium]